MKIETGHGTIPLITLIAMWSISLVVNLPGLAITPILSNIENVFPHASEIEIQMLTILPNLFIIPFVLLSGQLSVSRNKTGILALALVIYLVSGLLYFVASSMTELIIISCLLGVGCGLVIPIAAGLIADFFIGKYRMKQLGIKSGIANLSLVVATFTVGWLADTGGWRMPFIVYMIPLIPLLLTPFLAGKRVEQYLVQPTTQQVAAVGPDSRNMTISHATSSASPLTVIAGSPTVDKTVPPPPLGAIEWGRLSGAMLLYGVGTLAVSVIAYYLPFLAGDYHISDSMVGTITAIFFIAIMTPGFILPYIVHGLKSYTIPLAIAFIALGLGVGIISTNEWMFGISAFAMGFGYGVIQPIVYDKAVECSSGRKSTLALALVLSVNYAAVTLSPFFVDIFKSMLGANGNLFPYQIYGVIVIVFLISSLIFRKYFIFNVNENFI